MSSEKKPMSEAETRRHIIEHARVSGYEAPIRDIFLKIDEALKHARSQDERDYIAVQGLQEIDAYFNGGSSSLTGTVIKGIDQTTIDKFNKR